jgi:hypothetical protein
MERVKNAEINYTVSHSWKIFNDKLKAWRRKLSLPTLKNLEISRSHLVRFSRYTKFHKLKRGLTR